MERPDIKIEQNEGNENVSRNLLSSEAFTKAESIASAINTPPHTAEHLTNAMNMLSDELEHRASGNMTDYNEFLEKVARETAHRPSSDYHLELSKWNEATQTWGDVELLTQDNPVFKIIQPGDTLGQVAADYQMGGENSKNYMNRLAQANHIEDPNKIIVGQSINLLHGD